MVEPDNGGITFIRNVRKLSPYHMVSFPEKDNHQTLPCCLIQSIIGASFQMLILVGKIKLSFWDLRFLQKCHWRLKSAGIQYCSDLYSYRQFKGSECLPVQGWTVQEEWRFVQWRSWMHMWEWSCMHFEPWLWMVVSGQPHTPCWFTLGDRCPITY